MSDGGYDDGYECCECFWGRSPGSLIQRILNEIDLRGSRVLDLGCGEGKNAAALALAGCRVTAVDISPLALRNGRRAWPQLPIEWMLKDALEFETEPESFNIVVAYGLMHCLRRADIDRMIRKMQLATMPDGYNVLVAFNDRYQDLSGHPGFTPTLLGHMDYLEMYRGWDLDDTDEDLHEVHPHNGIPHVHSLTRLLAQRST